VGWDAEPAEAEWPRALPVSAPLRQGLDRVRLGAGSPLRLALARIGLPAWFVAIDVLWVAKFETLGIDARHYQAAATAWLAGADPWATRMDWIPFAAGPHTLAFYAPTSLLPPLAAEWLWLVAGFVAAAWLVRRLDVPLWWTAFPPLFHAAWNGNPQTLMLALLVAGTPVAAVLAVGLKYYAAVPLLARPRHLAAALIVLLVTLPLVPWQLYLADGLGVSVHLATAWNGSAARYPILIPAVLLALWVLRRQGANWLAVPVLWPATQFYYVSLALPALVRRPLLAAAFALPAPLLAPIAVLALAVIELLRQRRAPIRREAPGPAAA
jgi:hypothetical protein